MASKITGAQVEYDPASPLIDVDTAIEDLAEDLQRSGRQRQLVALQHLCGIVRRESKPWQVLEHDGENLVSREIESVESYTRCIVLEPLEDAKAESES